MNRTFSGEVPLKTLLDAVLLVAAVVLLFLQNWRSAIIPLLAVPVAIIGTFVVMAALFYRMLRAHHSAGASPAAKIHRLR